MKVFDDFHPVHYDAVRMEKLGLPVRIDMKGSTHKIYMFQNGYGASVVNGYMSMGIPELAVIHFNNWIKIRRMKTKRMKKKMFKQSGGYEMTYSTVISNDVKRYDDMNELTKDLNRISRLKPI
jgi:hypothetical protein